MPTSWPCNDRIRRLREPATGYVGTRMKSWCVRCPRDLTFDLHIVRCKQESADETPENWYLGRYLASILWAGHMAFEALSPCCSAPRLARTIGGYRDETCRGLLWITLVGRSIKHHQGPKTRVWLGWSGAKSPLIKEWPEDIVPKETPKLREKGTGKFGFGAASLSYL